MSKNNAGFNDWNNMANGCCLRRNWETYDDFLKFTFKVLEPALDTKEKIDRFSSFLVSNNETIGGKGLNSSVEIISNYLKEKARDLSSAEKGTWIDERDSETRQKVA